MVEQAAQLNRSSSASSVSESSVSSQDVPIVEGESTAPLYACLGPWGCWHSLLPPDESGIVHTACGLALGTASFTSNAPPHPLCRRRACVAARSQVSRCFLPALRSDRAVPRQAHVCSDSRSASTCYCSPAAFFCSNSLPLAVLPGHGYSRTSVRRCIGRTFRLARQHAGFARPLPRTGKHRHRIGARFSLSHTTAQQIWMSSCQDKYDELWLGLGITDPAHSPTMARLRRALKRAQNLTELADSPATASTSTPSAPASLNAWAEHAPPRPRRILALRSS